MMKDRIKSVLLNTVILLVFVFIVLAVYLSQHWAVIKYDDAYCIFWDSELTKFNQLFISVYHGRYLANILTKFFGFVIPNMFQIHPNVWIQTGGALIKGILTAIVMFSISRLAFINRDKNFLFPFIAIAVFIFYFSFIFYEYENILYCSFYGFTFNFLFYSIFLYYVIKNFDNKFLSNKDFIIMLILAFIAGCSTEFTIITTFIAYTLISLFKVINKTYSIKHAAIYISMLTAIPLYFFNPGFIETAREKEALAFNKVIIEILPQFIRESFNTFINEYAFFTIIIFVLLLVFYYQNKNNFKNFAQIILSLLTASIMFSFLLLFSGKKVPEGTLYVNHLDIVLQIKLFLITIIIVEFSFIKSKINYIFFTFVVLMFLIFKISDVKNEYIKLKERGYLNYLYASIDFSAYQERYIIERIIAYYSYRSDDFILYLPPQAVDFTLNDPTFYVINMYNSKYKIPRRYCTCQAISYIF